MILLDSDHLSILQHPESPKFERLTAGMGGSADQDFATTVISLEEQMRGWLAAINRAKSVHDQIIYYRRLADLTEFYSRWPIADFDKSAADQFIIFRRMKLRVATLDLKIASIAVTTSATLLSANLRDFEQVPGLRVEDWLR